MKWIWWMAPMLVATLVTGCGGGGGNAGTSVFGGGTTTTTPTTTVSTASSVDVLTSAVQGGSGTDQVTISAVVKDAGNSSLASNAVAFSADSGTLTSAAASTDTAGTATAVLSAGADKSNRTINVTVRSGTATGTVAVQVAGTKIVYSGATTVALTGSAQMSVQALDSKGVGIAGAPLTVRSALNNGLSATTLTTDPLGAASFTYTATNSGTDTVTVSGLGTTTTASVLISAANFAFVSPAPSVQIPVSTSQVLSVRYLSNGVAQSGRTVYFSSTAGTVSAGSAVTDATGTATVSVLSTTAGSATVQATLGGGSAQATLPVSFVAVTPAKVILQTTPTAIGANAGSSTSQQAKLLATVTDANGNPVYGATVTFNRVVDPSGGTLSQASAVTDSSGQASVQYIAGALTTSSNGVQLQASVLGGGVVSPPASLTVNQSALFIALGTGNTITNIDPQTYKKDWVVYVTDANGVAVPNVVVTMSVLPLAYGKGRLTYNGTSWVINQAISYSCANEDTDYSGVYSTTKDVSRNGRLDPGNVISVSTTGGSSSTATGSVTTDSTGRATVSVIYAESYAPWVQVALRAQAVVSGTQSSTSATFTVAGESSDFTNATVPPAGVTSPFGIESCTSPN